MTAYVLADIDVQDHERYEEYRRQVAATVAAFGGRYLVRGGSVELLEGTWQPQRLVVLEFPTRERARAWWSSEAYTPLRALRHETAQRAIILVEGASA